MKTKLSTLFSIYNASIDQINSLKEQIYLAAMSGNTTKVSELKNAIVEYERDLTNFENQFVEYKAIGEK